MPGTSLQDRFLGCILGQAIGDSAGAPFEGLDAETIYRDFGPVSDQVLTSNDTLRYTDDTQMMIGIAECLLEKGCIDPDALGALFARNYEPSRCYGAGARQILNAMRLGEDWKSLVETIFPGGSLGNGAAMRVAPIGLVFRQDREWLRHEAKLSAEVTHHHPIGVDGAAIFAGAVASAVSRETIDSRSFFNDLLELAETEEFRWQLSTAAKLDRNDSVTFGNSLEAHRSVTSALLCFTNCSDSYADTIFRAISMGNDTDTLAGMAGALSGAFLGVQAIPKQLLGRLENGPKGCSYLHEIAKNLVDLSQRAAP